MKGVSMVSIWLATVNLGMTVVMALALSIKALNSTIELNYNAMLIVAWLVVLFSANNLVQNYTDMLSDL